MGTLESQKSVSSTKNNYRKDIFLVERPGYLTLKHRRSSVPSQTFTRSTRFWETVFQKNPPLLILLSFVLNDLRRLRHIKLNRTYEFLFKKKDIPTAKYTQSYVFYACKSRTNSVHSSNRHSKRNCVILECSSKILFFGKYGLVFPGCFPAHLMALPTRDAVVVTQSKNDG